MSNGYATYGNVDSFRRGFYTKKNEGGSGMKKRINTTKETYEPMLEAYYEDEMSEEEYQEHLKDEGFTEYAGRLSI